jgi:hypothetical protein
MKKVLVVLVSVMILNAGCDGLRLPASEIQKQNAWLHNRTAQAAAQAANAEQTSEGLQKLTTLSETQSRAFVFDYGMPEQLPNAWSDEDILSQGNFDLAQTAISDSQRRNNLWNVADGAMDLGIGLAGLLGGVYGLKVAGFLTMARTKSKALREIIKGNEIFKQISASSIEEFKQAHQTQSQQTKKIVTEIKNS